MGKTRYPQFCALARAAELLGERWTLLIVRELLLGPKRFTDLRQQLDGITSSMLTERLKGLEEDGLIGLVRLEPPAASKVYELTPDGRDLEPIVLNLIRWGARFMLPGRPDERLDAGWIELVLKACARTSAGPKLAIELRITDGKRSRAIAITRTNKGTEVGSNPHSVDAIITAPPDTVLALMTRTMGGREALKKGGVKVEGNRDALAIFPQLFEVELQRKNLAERPNTGGRI